MIVPPPSGDSVTVDLLGSTAWIESPAIFASKTPPPPVERYARRTPRGSAHGRDEHERIAEERPARAEQPGGHPRQARRVYNEVRRLASCRHQQLAHDLPVIAGRWAAEPAGAQRRRREELREAQTVPEREAAGHAATVPGDLAGLVDHQIRKLAAARIGCARSPRAVSRRARRSSGTRARGVRPARAGGGGAGIEIGFVEYAMIGAPVTVITLAIGWLVSDLRADLDLQPRRSERWNALLVLGQL